MVNFDGSCHIPSHFKVTLTMLLMDGEIFGDDNGLVDQQETQNLLNFFNGRAKRGSNITIVSRHTSVILKQFQKSLLRLKIDSSRVSTIFLPKKVNRKKLNPQLPL